MRNYIILNGQNSNSISGLLIQSLAPISKPQMRTQTEEIDGRPGDIVTDLGFSSYDKEITIGLYGNFDINEVIAYFNSQGVVTFSNEPDKYYNYKIYDQIDFERLVRYRTATVTMRCQPFKYSTTEQPDNITPTDNLLTIPDVTKTANGVTVKAANGTLTVSGTATAATEVYVPISALTLQAGSYTLTATASGQNPTNCSIRMIGSAPSNSDSFGGNYLPLVQGTTTLSGTLSASKTYNYIWFYINAGTAMGFTLNISVEDEAAKVVSDEGTNLVLEGSQLAPFSKLDLKGNTEQDGTPTPDAPVAVQTVTGENVVKICGKNLADIPDFSVAGSGYAIGASDGAVSVDSTTTNRAISLCSGTDGGAWLPAYTSSSVIDHHITGNGGSYTISLANVAKTITGSQAFYVSVYTNKRSVANTTLTSSSNFAPSTITLDSDEHIKDIWIWVGSNTTYNVSFNIQLELGSSASSFEPYQGQSYEVNLGKNLFDVNGITENTAATTNGTENHEVTYSTHNSRAVTLIKVEPNTTYKLSIGDTSYSSRIYFVGMKNTTLESGHSFSWCASGATLTTGAGDNYLLGVIEALQRGTIEKLANAKIQLEKGSQATSYAAYFEPIKLCGLGDDGAGGYLYKDSIYKNLTDNKWYVHKEVGKNILDGSENWWESGAQTDNVYQVATGGYAGVPVSAGYSDSLEIITTTAWYAERLPNKAIFTSNNIYVRVSASLASTLEQFKAWLASRPTTVYYVLATPTDTEITNEALIEQLDDIYYHAHAYKERTHVSSLAATGNVPHIIAAAVAQNNDGVVTNSGNYFSKPRLTIYGEGEIGVYLNGIQIFQIALGSEGYITIDTAALEAYKDTTDNLKNRLVTGDYENFALRPGENQLSFSGSVTKCIVENYSRWL